MKLPKTIKLLDNKSFGWFRFPQAVWFICKENENILVWTDENGYDKGMINNPVFNDLLFVLHQCFLVKNT